MGQDHPTSPRQAESEEDDVQESAVPGIDTPINETLSDGVTRDGALSDSVVEDDILSAGEQDLLEALGIEITEPSEEELDRALEDEEALDEVPEADLLVGISTDDVLSLYLRRIGQVPLLTREEEVALAKQIEIGKAAEQRLAADDNLTVDEMDQLQDEILKGEAARERFIEANTRLVVNVAKRYRNYGLPFQDLIQAGNIGLIRAVDKFDYEMGNRFSTYAMWWVRQAIKRTLTQQGYTIRLPYYLRSRLRQVAQTRQRLEKQIGRRPTIQEIAEALGETDVQQLRRLVQISQRTVSLNTPVGDEGDSELLHLLEDEVTPSPPETVQSQLMHEDLTAVMNDALTDREIDILSRRFGLNDHKRHTLQELADDLGISRERVRQIERKALRKLRHPYQRHRLLDYLR